MQVQKIGIWEWVGGGTVVALLLLFGITATVGWAWLDNPNAAAWVQAVGSVVALFLTGGLAVWEARQRRRDDAAGVGDRLDTRVAVIAQASSLIRAYLERHTVANKQKHPGPHATYRSARFLIAAAREVAFSDMPSPQCVEALAIAQSALVTVEERMKNAGEVWLHQQEIEDIDRRQKLLEGAIKTLREEVRRLRA